MFGQALADALMLPLNAFNKLRSGIDWVLEKLGVINKESDTLDQAAARTRRHVWQRWLYSGDQLLCRLSGLSAGHGTGWPLLCGPE